MARSRRGDAKAYMDENRAQDATAGSAETTDEDDDGDASHIKYIVESTGALLTLENARGHLHHFCAVAIRHNSRYIDPRPEFTTKQHPVLKPGQLPSHYPLLCIRASVAQKALAPGTENTPPQKMPLSVLTRLCTKQG